MNKFEFLVKLIVPAFFLIVWALQQIFGKEAPVTPKGGRALGTPGGLPPTRRPGADREDPFRDADEALRTVPSSPSSRPTNDIIILSSETIRRPPPAQPRPAASRPAAERGRNTQPRRGRPKTPAAPATPAETVRSRSLSPSLTQSVALSIQRPTEIQAVSQSLSLPTLDESRSFSEQPESTVASSTSTALRTALTSPTRLRESLILSEVLQRPLAMRRR